jgi:predicted DCC family thiol-disulfide oxidoreductase YuxK
VLTAIYDGRCLICQTTRRLVSALDWRGWVQWLDLHEHETVAVRFPHLDHARLMGEIHVIDETGQLFAGFQGLRRMLRALPVGFPLYLMLRLPVVGGWLDRLSTDSSPGIATGSTGCWVWTWNRSRVKKRCATRMSASCRIETWIGSLTIRRDAPQH